MAGNMTLAGNSEFKSWVSQLKKDIRSAQIKAAIKVNTELLRLQPELLQVKLTLHIQNSVASGSSNDPISDPISDPINLTERQKMILRMFSEEKSLSRERLCEKTGLSDATAKREIAFLKKAGYLKRVGSLKAGHWIVIPK